jgi:RNA polymerase sigma factor (sigma-70 family)
MVATAPAPDVGATLRRLDTFLRCTAAKLARRTARYGLDAEDLYQEGAAAVVAALPRYDEGRGVYFLQLRARGAMVDLARGWATLSRRQFARVLAGERPPLSVLPLRVDDGCDPTRYEDAEVGDGERAEFLALVCRVGGNQSPGDAELLARYLVDGLLMRQIADEIGLSESRVSQRITRILDGIREQLRARGLTRLNAFT